LKETWIPCTLFFCLLHWSIRLIIEHLFIFKLNIVRAKILLLSKNGELVLVTVEWKLVQISFRKVFLLCIQSFKYKEGGSCSEFKAMSNDERPSIFFLNKSVVDLRPLFSFLFNHSHVVVIMFSPEENRAFEHIRKVFLFLVLKIEERAELKVIWNEIHEGED
jgi:hypothetical protein